MVWPLVLEVLAFPERAHNKDELCAGVLQV